MELPILKLESVDLTADLTSESFFNHEMEISGGVLEKECKELLQSFFKSRRKDN